MWVHLYNRCKGRHFRHKPEYQGKGRRANAQDFSHHICQGDQQFTLLTVDNNIFNLTARIHVTWRTDHVIASLMHGLKFENKKQNKNRRL